MVVWASGHLNHQSAGRMGPLISTQGRSKRFSCLLWMPPGSLPVGQDVVKTAICTSATAFPETTKCGGYGKDQQNERRNKEVLRHAVRGSASKCIETSAEVQHICPWHSHF